MICVSYKNLLHTRIIVVVLAPLSQRLWMSYDDHLPSVILWTTSLNPLGQFSSNFMWSLLLKGAWKFVQMVTVRISRWPPCSYMVKTLKSLLQNQESFMAESWYTRFTKFVQMMTLGWPLTFSRQGQICVPMHLYGENVKKLFFSKCIKD